MSFRNFSTAPELARLFGEYDHGNKIMIWSGGIIKDVYNFGLNIVVKTATLSKIGFSRRCFVFQLTS